MSIFGNGGKINDFFASLKEKFLIIKEKVQDFIQENRTVSLCIGGLSILIIVSIILLFIAAGSKSGKKNKTKNIQRPVTYSEEILVPPSPLVSNGYQSSRTTKEKWENDEIEPWFTKPGQKEIDDLSNANDRIINEITGAAP